MKIGNEYISIEVTCKRSTNVDPITQDTVEKCIRIAMDAHEGQRDRDGNAVILHPLLVGSMGQTDAESVWDSFMMSLKIRTGHLMTYVTKASPKKLLMLYGFAHMMTASAMMTMCSVL